MQNYLEIEDKILAPYAMKSKYSRGRRYPEKTTDLRTPFQRDRDRIIHCSAFRRLENKTQVFVIFEGDYYRTRLTHTMEVAQIARTCARALQLNEDLAEAIALAHDLGHSPFGHTGEEVLHSLMIEHGGFEHNWQSLRIVDELETRYPKFPGLNLTWEVREGIMKHKTLFDNQFPDNLEKVSNPSLEAQMVNIADEITYSCHDVDDGLKSGILTEDGLITVQLCHQILSEIQKESSNLQPKMRRYWLIRSLINAQIRDLISQTTANLKELNINTLDEVRECPQNIVNFTREMAEKTSELKTFLYKNFYRHHRVAAMSEKAKRFITTLFNTYLDNFELIPADIRTRNENDSEHRIVCDYIAGMTDRYAIQEYKRLFEANEVF